MTRRLLRVVKVGGSLLDWKPLPTILRQWLTHRIGTTILIAGGGPFADLIRAADERFGLDDEAAHLLGLGAMRLSSELFSQLLPEFALLRDFSLLRQRSTANEQCALIFDPSEFATSDRGRLLLPASWDVTSDSIAAVVAAEAGADELVLLKSTDLPRELNWQQAGEQGLVDRYFHTPAKQLSQIHWINFRHIAEYR